MGNMGPATFLVIFLLLLLLLISLLQRPSRYSWSLPSFLLCSWLLDKEGTLLSQLGGEDGARGVEASIS